MAKGRPGLGAIHTGRVQPPCSDDPSPGRNAGEVREDGGAPSQLLIKQMGMGWRAVAQTGTRT